MSGPIDQEARKGHKLFQLTADTYGEVSRYRGKVYVSVRRWFQADDQKWYRTKNGLNLPIDDFHALWLKVDDFKVFTDEEAKNPWEDE